MMHDVLGFTPDFHVGLRYDADVCHAAMDMCGVAVRDTVSMTVHTSAQVRAPAARATRAVSVHSA